MKRIDPPHRERFKRRLKPDLLNLLRKPFRRCVVGRRGGAVVALRIVSLDRGCQARASCSTPLKDEACPFTNDGLRSQRKRPSLPAIHGSSQADEEVMVVRIDRGASASEVRGYGDFVCGRREYPRLCVVTVGSQSGKAHEFSISRASLAAGAWLHVLPPQMSAAWPPPMAVTSLRFQTHAQHPAVVSCREPSDLHGMIVRSSVSQT
jgi:hypothetical protein